MVLKSYARAAGIVSLLLFLANPGCSRKEKTPVQTTTLADALCISPPYCPDGARHDCSPQCMTIELEGERSSDPGSQTGEHTCLCRPMEVTIPSVLPVTAGSVNSSHYSLLYFRRVATSTAPPTFVGCMYTGDDDQYELLNCDDGTLGGTTANVNYLGLYVVSGASPLTHVRVDFDETPTTCTTSTTGMANVPPTITSAPPITAIVGQPWGYYLTATDPNPGNTTTFELGWLRPSNMYIYADPWKLHWVPTYAQLGSQTVEIRAGDDVGACEAQTFNVLVQPPLAPPVITSTAGESATVGVLYFYAVMAEDANHDDLTYQLDQAPAGMTISSTSGLVLWTPTGTDVGTTTVTVRVTDTTMRFDRQTYRLTVTAAGGGGSDGGVDASVDAAADGGTADAAADGGILDSSDATVADASPDAGPASDAADLPPDPASIATAIPPGVFTPFYDRVRFLVEATPPVQRDVEEGAIDETRASVTRGRIRVRGGGPLAGVRVTVADHPELGYTLSRADGAFDLVVNAGGFVTLDFSADGYGTVQRRWSVRAHDLAAAPEVAMTPLDTAVTSITLASLTDHAIASASAVTDSAGTRRASILVAPGTSATMTLPNGTTQSLATVSIRATEYTVGPDGPAAMPGELPMTSGYTYAAELSVDEALAAGAVRVDFSSPVAFYVDNALEFPVGEIVPLGYYDRGLGAWIPAPDGRIVELINVVDDVANLDLDGDGIAEDDTAHEALGITEGERRALALDRAPGDELWRAPIPHFTPWDCNWPFGPPGDADWPDFTDLSNSDDPCERTGSFLECQDRGVRQRHDVDGTPLSLEHRSRRLQAGRAPLRVSLAGSQLSASVQRIHTEVSVGGQVFSRDYTPTANLSDAFAWDGRDVYGRVVSAPTRARIRVGYEYAGVYRRPATSIRAFAQSPSGTVLVTGSASNRTVTLWRSTDVVLPGRDPREEGFGGWHAVGIDRYDPELSVVQTSRGRVQRLTSTVNALAGTGAEEIFDHSTDSETTPNLSRVTSLAYGSDGTLYVAESGSDFFEYTSRIRRRRPNGTWSLIAGGLAPSTYGVEGVGGPAIDARFTSALGPIALGPDETVYFADDDGIFHITRNGVLERIAGAPGTDPELPTPDGTLALDAFVRQVYLLEVGPDGTVYFVRLGTSNSTFFSVVAIMPDGRMQTIAGSVIQPVTGISPPENSVAKDVRLNRIDGLAIGDDGTVYLSEQGRVWRVDQNGQLQAVARTSPGFTPDLDELSGQSALSLPPMSFGALEVDRDGSLIAFVDANNGAERPRRYVRLTTDGRFVPILGYLTGSREVWSNTSGFAIRPNGGLAWIHNPGTRGDFIYGQDTSVGATPGCSFSATAENGEWARCFDTSGRLVGLDALLTGTRHFSFTYDGADRLSTVTDVDGLVTQVERGTDGAADAVVGPYGHRTELETNSNGWLTAIEAPDSTRTTFEPNVDGFIGAKTDARGARSTYSYPGGSLFEATDRVGNTQRFESSGPASVRVTSSEGIAYNYDFAETTSNQTAGVIRRHTSGAVPNSSYRINGTTRAERNFPDGTTAMMTSLPDPVHGASRPVLAYMRVTRPSGVQSVTQGRRTIVGDVTTDILIVNGRQYETRWDASARTLTSVTPEGRTASLVFDARDRLAEAYMPGFAPHLLEYDGDGRATGLTVGAETSTFSYDSRSHLEGVARFDGQESHFLTDDRGRITSEETPSTSDIGFTYDENGNLESLTPPGQPAHSFSYDANDRIARVDLPDVGGGATYAALTRNRDGQPTTLRRPDGTTVVTARDTRGRVQSITSGGSQRTLEYFNDTDELAAIQAPSGIRIAYLHDGPVVQQIAVTGAVQGYVSYEHDSDGYMYTRTIGPYTSTRRNYRYDADKLLTTAGPLTLTYAATSGLPTGMSTANTVTTYSSHGDGELFAATTSVSGTQVHRIEILRDATGRVLEETETILGTTTTWSYARTPDGFLDHITRNGTLEEEATYDTQGNRETRTVGAAISSATYDAQDRLLTSGDWELTYRTNGEVESRTNTASSETWTHEYDAFGSLVGVTLPDTREVTYLVDGLGRRVARAVAGTTTHRWLYGEALTPIAELDAFGAVTTEYIYAGQLHTPAAMIRSGQTYRIVTDMRGSVRLVINASSGVVAQRIDYDRWGQVVLDTNPGFQPFGYAGGLWDAETGLVRFGARDYSPELNRWTSKDPLGFAAGDTSLYAYALGDPVSFVDPDGEFCFIPLIFLAIKVVDFAWNAYDTYQTAKRLMDPCVSTADKATEVGLLAAQWLLGKALGKGLNALQKTKAISKLGCFAAGTLVLAVPDVAGPPVPTAIESLQRGTTVRSFDAATKQTVDGTVVALHRRQDVATIEVGLEAEGVGSTVLTTTPEHPLWSWSQGAYVRADHLHVGDFLLGYDGGVVRVASVGYTGRRETVFNLTVENSESYYVGDFQVVAHNLPSCGHHPIPKALGGFDKGQPLADIHPDVHKDLHSVLNDELRSKGLPHTGGGPGNGRIDNIIEFNANPGMQQKALDVVVDVTKRIDQKWGTDISTILNQNLINGKYTRYP